jgi:hypothetical protein
VKLVYVVFINFLKFHLTPDADFRFLKAPSLAAMSMKIQSFCELANVHAKVKLENVLYSLFTSLSHSLTQP